MSDGIDATTQTPTPEQPVPLSERAEKIINENWSRVTEENANDGEANAEQTAPTSDTPADEQAVKPTTEAAKPEAITPEQLADTKFWGQLDKAGWDRMEREFPVATAHVKAAIAAGSRIVNEARKTTQPPANVANDKPNEAQNSPERQEALRKANSLDQVEAAEGLDLLVDLRVKKLLPEFGLDPVVAQANKVARAAYAAVIADNAAIANLDPNALDAAVDNDATLTQLLEAATDLPEQKRIAITAGVMRKAAETVMQKQTADAAAKAADDAKKTESQRNVQRKVNSNATVVSNTVVDSPAGGTPKGKRTPEEIATSMWPSGS